MAFTFIVKNTSIAGREPTVGQIQKGELAVNLVDHKLYSHGYDENGQDVIFEIGEAGETPSGGTDERPSGPSLGDLYFDTDLEVLLYWNGSEWVPVGTEALELNDLTDVDTSGVTDGMVLAYNGANWVPFDPATFNVQAGRALSYDNNTDPDTLNADIATETSLGVVSVGEGLEVSLLGELSTTPVEIPPGTIISETAPADPEAGQLWWADTDVDDGGGRLYIYTGDEWVDTSLPGAGDFLSVNQADDLYLSKTVDDEAAGAITFKGQTTHEGGVKVTGGDEHISANGFNGIAVDSNDFMYIVTDPAQSKAINFRVNDKNQAAVNSLGRFVNMLDAKLPGTLCLGYQTSGNIGIGQGTEEITGYRSYFGIENDYGDTGVPNTIDGVGFLASTDAGKSSFSNDVARAANRLKTYASFRSIGITDAALDTYAFYADTLATSNTNNYNFYAAGSAPNFFAGFLRTGNATNPGGTASNSQPEADDLNHRWTSQSDASNALRIASSYIMTSRYSTNTNHTCEIYNRLGSPTGKFVEFRENGVEVDSIRLDGAGGVSFGTSDYRTKENIVDLPSAVDQIKALRPVNFNYKWAQGKTRPGFVAHELAEALPVAVVGEKDETESIGIYTDVDGNVETEVPEPEAIPFGATWEQTGTRDVYQGVDQTKLIPLLTKALQEVIAENEDIKARLAALEGA